MQACMSIPSMFSPTSLQNTQERGLAASIAPSVAGIGPLQSYAVHAAREGGACVGVLYWYSRSVKIAVRHVEAFTRFCALGACV